MLDQLADVSLGTRIKVCGITGQPEIDRADPGQVIDADIEPAADRNLHTDAGAHVPLICDASAPLAATSQAAISASPSPPCLKTRSPRP